MSVLKKIGLYLFFIFVSQTFLIAASDSDISISSEAFSPYQGQTLSLTFRSPQAGKIRAEILDIEGKVIRTLADSVNAGLSKYEWDGKDANGVIVKDGCYIPQIKVESATNPVSFRSSTQQLKEVQVKPDYYDRLTGVLSYTLLQSSLVTVKAEIVQHNKATGDVKHVIKKVIAENAARTAGKVVEYFDGYADDGVYLPNSNYAITITAKPLPPNTIIVYGGSDLATGGSQ